MATNPLIDRIMDQLRLKLPGALDGVTQIELWNTVDDFLCRTNVWIADTEVKLKPDKIQADLDSPTAGASIWRLMELRNEDGSHYPVAAWIPVPGTLQFASPSNEAKVLVATVALTIGDPGKRQVYPDMPDWIWSDYYDVLIDGTIGRMYGQPAKPYSNPQMAAYHLKSFTSGVNQSKWMASRGRRMEGQRWRFPQSYAGRMLRRP
jgi:hypothetical protein